MVEKKWHDEHAVATAIGTSIAKKLGYRRLTGKNLLGIYFLTLSSDNKETKYLNILITDNGNSWGVAPVNIVITKDCLMDLNDEEHNLLFNKGTMCQYGDFYISVEKDMSGTEILNCITNKPPIIRDKSIMARRKKVSDIIQNYFQILDIKRPVEDPNEEEYLSKMNMRTEVVDKIATYCRQSLRCKDQNVRYVQDGDEEKITISLLGRDNVVFELFAIVDEKHVGIFYMENNNGKWEKRLLPETIGEIIGLFKKRD